MYSKEIDFLIKLLSSLPALDQDQLKNIIAVNSKNTLMLPLGKMITDVANKISICINCGNYDSVNPCAYV